MLPDSFHWVLKDKLAGTEKPNKKQLHMYKEMGFNGVVCLQENIKKTPLWGNLSDYDFCGYTRKDVTLLGMDFLHLPIEDMKPPSKKQMEIFIDWVNQPGRVVLVHCWGGIGRTGCMLMAYLGVMNNLSGKSALSMVRDIWRPYVQTEEQENAVIDFIDSNRYDPFSV